MKITTAFLASLLFFGVTPLALSKKSDEHLLTTISSPFASTSTIALVTPENAGVVEHDVLAARGRGRGSRGGSSSKTTSPLQVKKTKTKTKKEGKDKAKTGSKTKGEKTKTKTKCTAAMKKAGKCPAEATCTAAEKKKNGGECPATCTAAEKKKNGGKCPEKKKRNWEVLSPTKGCRPSGAKKSSKKTTATKGGKKTTRDISSPHSPSLSKRSATFEPAAKTEAGLNAWTKDVWASSPKVLHMPEDSFKPTSFFKSWASLGKGVNFVTVKSLMGCTSVVAVSDEGVYVSHHWQNTVGDASYKDLTPQFDNAFTNPLSGKRRASFKLTPAQHKEATLYMSEADVKKEVDDVFPATGFEALTDVKSHFTTASNVKSMVAVWDGVEGTGDRYRTTGPLMQRAVDGLLPGTATKLVKYENSEDARSTSGDNGDYHGKVIVSYDSATKKYQVWMPAAQLSGPILKN
ncbi:hypothetical protein PMIN06_001945 [Paraphaeosphaeria minitans]|uniref:Uncharacterized protein n=1 Tax=Paraphaeosphaeria minitans TaxID=565426 RepID=A0A9P6GNF7_9PLEO|nr:hypothetical protein PMIN01_03927 [Paraphaeosphaeria minitans]